MRIAFLVDQFPALSETFILNQIIGMIEGGHEVDIYPNKLGNFAKMHPEVESYQLLNRTFYPQMPANRFVRVLKGLGFIFSNASQNPAIWLRSLNVFKYGSKARSLTLLYSVFRFVGKQPYDIIHCQIGFVGLQGLLFRNIGVLNGKLIVSFRGADFISAIHKFGDRVYDPLFEQGDLFLAVSESVKRQMIELGCDEKKIVVHRSGLDCENFVFTPRLGHPDRRVRLLTIARLVENKGVEYGIRALAKLVQVYPHIEYHIVGDGPLREDLQRLIQELNLDGTVSLLGWKQRQEVIEILDHSDILLAPSVIGKDGEQEGIPNVLKEAMAMGLPVIGTLHSGIPELIEDGVSGFLVPERDADALAEKLSYLIDRPEIWPEMGRAGRAQVEENYDIHKLNDRLVEIYQQLLLPDSKLSMGS